MRHRSLIFCVIAVLALGLIGFGYAAWSSTVTVNATVNTGKLQLGIATGTTTPATGSPDYVWNTKTLTAAPNTQGLVVGSLTESNGTALSGYTGYYSSVTEAYATVYPFYAAGYTVSIANLGTIPIALNTPTIAWTGDSSVQADYTVYNWTLTDSSGSLASGTTNSLASIKGVVLPAGDVAALTVDAYFNDSTTELVQNATGAQTITITGTQFNVGPTS